ncbi:MAG: hypothetical protein MJZ25_04015 [Fibrobacter sp.]|nr:hypothetical protein [Fibrobacter sp.]
MQANGHFSGKMRGLLDKATEKSKGVDGDKGQFYAIMKSHGFYDVEDEENGLMDWQRAQVPDYNQHRISDLCKAIAEMFADYLGNEEYGVLDPGVEGVVNKLDQRGAQTAAEMDGIGGALGALTGGASEATRKSLSQIVAAVMGGCPFDPEILPPLCIGFDGLPISMANGFKIGTFVPDWTFLYDHETFKSNKFYEGSDGKVCIGAGIRLNLGGPARILVLKTIFSVPTVDENGQAQGDSMNGVTAEEFKVLYDVSDKNFSDLTPEELEFELREGQLQLAYFKMVNLILWGAIKNSNNWAFLHWGCIAHNSCPTDVKTAICSYTQTNGLAIDVDNCPESGMISYLVNTGMGYIIGKSKATGLILLPGMKYMDDAKKVITVEAGDAKIGTWFDDNNGLPKDTKLAKAHFILAADILSHLVYDTNPNAESLRRRRIDEANLIYKWCGMPTIKFGEPVSAEFKSVALCKRFMDILVESKPKVYENKNPKIPTDPNGIEVVNWAEKGANELSAVTLGTIRYLCAKAGLPGTVVTSVYRSPEAQTRAMISNLQNNNGKCPVNYAQRGRAVNEIYYKYSRQVNGGQVRKINDPAVLEKVRNEMIGLCTKYANENTPVSNHGYKQDVVQAVDMGPNSMRKHFKFSEQQLRKFGVACYDAYKEKYLKQYLGPEEYGGPKVKDPAFHIEVYQDNEHPHPAGWVSDAGDYSDVKILPSVELTIGDENLRNKNVWDLIFVHDQNYRHG